MKEQWKAQQRWDAFKGKMLNANRRTSSTGTAETNQKFSSTLNAIKY
jgi:hypothetical protein